MIYYVSNSQELFNLPNITKISVEESIKLITAWKVVQFDTETTGLDCRLDKLVLIQFGNKKAGIQIVIDATTIDILLYKDLLENKLLIGQNLKFDLQWLYNFKIIPLKVYDTMIVEQLLYLGFDFMNKKAAEYLPVGLAAILKRRLNIDMDKSVRHTFINDSTITDTKIIYAAKDVEYLEDIEISQLKELNEKGSIKAAQLECNFVPVIAYMEWCGIKLDTNKWKLKMQKDLRNYQEASKALDNFVIANPKLQEFVFIDRQGDLFEGFNTAPQCSIQWTSSAQVIKVAKTLGFNTTVTDKKTNKNKDSVIEKLLKKQKGICDEFLKLYFGKGEEGDEDYYPGHQGSHKVVTSFGQGHLNSINPKTNRIHTIYNQLGADTGRMSCGSKGDNNDSIAKVRGFPTHPTAKQKADGLGCPYPNMQQLPSDELTRACFISEPNNMWVSCDYSAIESRLGADIYQEKAMIEEFLHGSGDIHSLVAKMIFPELKDVLIKTIKKLYKHLRSKAKPVEFSQQFGGSPIAIQNAMGCTLEEAILYAEGYNKGFPGIAKFKIKGAKEVRSKGYVLLNPITGHKTYWWDWKIWKERQKSYTHSFWEDYKINHKGNKEDPVCQMVSFDAKVASKWDRKALNSVTQGTGAIILKESQIDVFNWVVQGGNFGIILLNNLTHDEANWEYPKEIIEFPKILKSYMEKTAAKYCKSLPIPADAEISDHWVH